MTSRITDLASSNSLISHLMRVQARLQDNQIQVSSGKISQTYSGIATASERLVNLENARDHLRNYNDGNDLMNLRLDITSTTIEAIQVTVDDFKEALDTFAGGDTTDKGRVEDIQDWAFRALLDMQGYLNTAADGRYIFGGADVKSKPVDFGFISLTALQAQFDGALVSYPTTRDGQLANFTINKDVVTNQTNWLTFERDNGGDGRITATSNNDFKNLKVGATITVSGTNNNNGTYTVKYVDTTNYNYITVETEMLTTRANDTGTGVTITAADESILTTADFTDLSFDRAAGTITGFGTPFSSLSAGEIITIANATDAANNTVFTIDSVTSTVITIKEKKLTDEGTAATRTLDYSPGGGVISFNENTPNADTIVAGANAFDNLSAGMKITISNTTAGANDGTFTVGSVSTDGTTITIAKNEDLAAQALDPSATINIRTTEAPGTITATSYYYGDSINPTHRIDADRSFDFDSNAISPAFEKAIRAMFIIAQGAYETEGGLDQNGATRVAEAKFLLTSTLDSTANLTGATGTELNGNIEQKAMDISFNLVRLMRTAEANDRFINYLDTQIAKSEDVDLLDAITRLLADSRALEASYQAVARVSALSLMNFL